MGIYIVNNHSVGGIQRHFRRHFGASYDAFRTTPRAGRRAVSQCFSAARAESAPGLYFLGDKIVEATIGTGETQWQAYVPWAKTVPAADREHVLQLLKLPEPTLSTPLWLTEFEDRSFPRPATDDVFFRTSENQTQRERPPTIQYVSNNLPGALMFCAVGLYLAAPGLLRRLRAQSR